MKGLRFLADQPSILTSFLLLMKMQISFQAFKKKTNAVFWRG